MGDAVTPTSSSESARAVRGRQRRLDPDSRLGLELTLWSVAAFVVLVPFGVLLALVRSHSSGLQSADQSVADHAHTLAVNHHGLVRFLQDVSNAFAPRTFWILIALLTVVLVIRHAARLALWAAITMAGAALLDNVIKTVADRARPHLANPVASAPGKSFPSGHALESFVGVAIILIVAVPLLRPVWRRVAIAVAIVLLALIGFARVTLGVHYLSDVVGGWIFAVGWTVATCAGFRVWRKQVSPQSRAKAAGLDVEASEHLVGQ
ncbi:MAG TPA: phosphatase PAP2 family protein [Acidothermaceae bacterium]|nr:phosphatase PAP2 family protein [Acidothermaceae bacterium]